MIYTNELRIGNWVAIEYYDGKHSEQISFIDDSMPLEDYYPIQLTPELLEKAGFDVINRKDWEFRKGKMTFQLPRYTGGYLLNVFIGGEHISILQYVHQLQNLYFCLCGEELNIQL